MSLIASDGYEYEDLTQRILGNPKRNLRNGNFRCYSEFRGTAAGREYIRGFDSICPNGDPGPSPTFALAHAAGLAAIRGANAKHYGELVDAAVFTALSRRS